MAGTICATFMYLPLFFSSLLALASLRSKLSFYYQAGWWEVVLYQIANPSSLSVSSGLLLRSICWKQPWFSLGLVHLFRVGVPIRELQVAVLFLVVKQCLFQVGPLYCSHKPHYCLCHSQGYQRTASLLPQRRYCLGGIHAVVSILGMGPRVLEGPNPGHGGVHSHSLDHSRSKRLHTIQKDLGCPQIRVVKWWLLLRVLRFGCMFDTLILRPTLGSRSPGNFLIAA